MIALRQGHWSFWHYAERIERKEILESAKFE